MKPFKDSGQANDEDSELSDEPEDADVMPYNADQIEAIIAAAEGWERALVTLYFFTGIRRGEALALTWDRVYLDRGLLLLRMRQQLGSAILPRFPQPGDTAFHYACLLERSRLEPSVSREVFPRENTRQCWGNFVSKSAGILQRMSSPSVRDVPAVQPQNSGVARMQMKVQGLRIR